MARKVSEHQSALTQPADIESNDNKTSNKTKPASVEDTSKYKDRTKSTNSAEPARFNWKLTGERALIVATVLLVLATFLLFSATNSLNAATTHLTEETQGLTNATVSLHATERLLFTANKKEEIYEKMNLAQELLGEAKNNRNRFTEIIATAEKNRNNSMVPTWTFKTDKLTQAMNTIGFGSEKMKTQFFGYATALSDANKRIELMSNDITGSNFGFKDQHINESLVLAMQITGSGYFGIRIDQFINDTQDYITRTRKCYLALDRQLTIEATGTSEPELFSSSTSNDCASVTD